MFLLGIRLPSANPLGHRAPSRGRLTDPNHLRDGGGAPATCALATCATGFDLVHVLLNGPGLGDKRHGEADEM